MAFLIKCIENLSIALCLLLSWSADRASPKPRFIMLTYKFVISQIPSSARTMDCWVPVPQSDDRQTVEILSEDLKGGQLTMDPKYGNKIYYWHIDLPSKSVTDSLVITLSYRVSLEEKTVPEAKNLSPFPKSDVMQGLNVYLTSNHLIPLQGPVAELTRQLHLSAEPIRAARQVYDYLIRNMVYKYQASGAGRGDAVWACGSHTGDCSDYNSIFIGVCRNDGIPADHVFGLPLRSTQGTGTVNDWHCWARFWVPGLGWITVDPSEAAKHPELHDYNFGTLSNVYLALSHGPDVVLTPNQHEDPLNIFATPYVEIDNRIFGNIKWVGTYKEEKKDD